MNQQQQTHRLRTLSRSYWELKLTLLAKIIALDSAVVKTEKQCKARLEASLLIH